MAEPTTLDALPPEEAVTVLWAEVERLRAEWDRLNDMRIDESNRAHAAEAERDAARERAEKAETEEARLRAAAADEVGRIGQEIERSAPSVAEQRAEAFEAELTASAEREAVLRAEIALLRSPGADGCHTNACEWETTSGAYCTCASIAETELLRAELADALRRGKTFHDDWGAVSERAEKAEVERDRLKREVDRLADFGLGLRERAERAEAERDTLRARLTGVSIHARRLRSRLTGGTDPWPAVDDLFAALDAPHTPADTPKAVPESTEDVGPDIRMETIITTGGPAISARGATKRNGSTQILKKHGWYWLPPIRAYVTKGGPAVVAETVKALRDAGVTVNVPASTDVTGGAGEAQEGAR